MFYFIFFTNIRDFSLNKIIDSSTFDTVFDKGKYYKFVLMRIPQVKATGRYRFGCRHVLKHKHIFMPMFILNI